MVEPLVSVVMPVYNGEKYLKFSIESILSQTLVNFELIIINDGSLDCTEGIILSYDDPRIIYIKNYKNLGLVASLNIGISIAKGLYIARMDADDISVKDRLFFQYQFMLENPDIDICGGWIKFIGAETGCRTYPLDHESIKARMLFASAIAHPTVFCKRSFFDGVLYLEADFPIEDYCLWVSVINDKKFSNIPFFLLYYRVHNNQVSEKYNSNQIDASLRLQEFLLRCAGLDPSKDNMLLHAAAQMKICERSFDDILFWVSKIILSNTKSLYFDHNCLKDIIYNQLYKVIRKKINIYFLFKNFFLCLFVLIKKVRSVTKCLLKWCGFFAKYKILNKHGI